MELTPEIEAQILEMAAVGKSLQEIREVHKMRPMDFLKYRERHPIFAQAFHAARLEGLEEIADSLMNVADEYEDVQRGRLKSENYRWLLSKRKPMVYGDKLELNVNQSIDISGALLEAKRRAELPICYQPTTKEVQAIDITHDSQQPTTDKPSVSVKPSDSEQSTDPQDIDIFS